LEWPRAPDRSGSEAAGARLQPVEEATLGATANRCCNQGGAAELQLMAGIGAPKIPTTPLFYLMLGIILPPNWDCGSGLLGYLCGINFKR